MTLDREREVIREAITADEPTVVATLLRRSRIPSAVRHAVRQTGIDWVERCRSNEIDAGTLDVFLKEFGLSNNEGVALMCLAEALLRVPDADTADRLIAEKIAAGDWRSHLGHSSSAFVNASVWGLMLTGRWVHLDDEITERTANWMDKLVANTSESVIRRAILQAMRILGRQFVLGRTIGEARRRGRSSYASGTRFSYDMLGEGARTAQDAERYFRSYADAIRAIGERGRATDLESDSISVKLSALHPRYDWRAASRVRNELLPRLTDLALTAAEYGVALSIDAEEADRLELSLDLFASLAADPRLEKWPGLGFVLQAYQKRAIGVADWLIALGRSTGRRIPVRLVKGAYWDVEIKRAQELGLADYPVFTKKVNTDLSYQVCAEVLAAAPDAVFPQFASHNAHTIATARAVADGDFELQRLHGMGELLYREVLKTLPETPVRVYAPVGEHRDLLPYLVRRLLENGANSSFVNRLLDAETDPADLVRDPVTDVESDPVRRHAHIALPRHLHTGAATPWSAAQGIDLADPLARKRLLAEIEDARRAASPISIATGRVVENPADRQPIGDVADADDVVAAARRARASYPAWDALGVHRRAACLDDLADEIEAHRGELIDLIVREAGRTIEDAIDEVREAVDFCRYYAATARSVLRPRNLTGPTGEQNQLFIHGRGVWACISPWNFPLAIFIGQIAAALVTGNTVLAKPADQTPLIAARAIDLMLGAGVPDDVVQLLPGPGHTVGDVLIGETEIDGVAFTGSTHTARRIARRLAAKDGPLTTMIAETGGINVMIVDATALPEQVVDDVITSAFGSAGQRCSALRVLYLQRDVAEAIIGMLTGAMNELVVGDPARVETDIGPVIDADAAKRIQAHIDQFTATQTLIAQCPLDDEHASGYFIAPTIFEIERLSDLTEEIFGPVLHVIRYDHDELDTILNDINESRFGLTLGVHSRIEAFADEIVAKTRVGNTYINRNMIGAVVGVNPFGGQGLSGTGPKAGGPHYLFRFVTERTRTENVTARGGNATLFNLRET